jgi:hypothetical protein
MVGLCESCVVNAQCGPLARCIPLTNGEHACAAICERDIPSCPRGFECVERVEVVDFTVCAPIGETCCVDSDADGYGTGVGCDGPDCDDEDIDVNPGIAELCNGDDDDCDDTVDEEFSDCGGQECREAGAGYEEVTPGECVSGDCVDGDATTCGYFACELGADEGDRCATTCVREGVDDDLLCIETAHCDLGSCTPDVDDGEMCDEDTDCEGGHCDNGFCCDDGTCCNDASDCPSTGGIGTTCDDSATCQGTRGEIECEDFQCATNEGIPDDSACDDDVEANPCGFFRSVFCTGMSSQPPPSCPGTCASNDACDEGAHCDTVCIPDVEDGGICDEDSDCASEHCDNNVCCATGDCCRTAVDCPSSYSTSATCDIPSACQGTRDSATCSDYVCGTAEDVGDDSACTSSIEALGCGLYPSRFCSGGTDQTVPVCAMSCASDAECDESAHCDGSTCFADQDNGTSCDEASDCSSNHCQNGFCCATGDCCARGTDCSAALYGEAPRCITGSTCQGERRDPVCNAASQCAVGGITGDDSGCVGTLSNTCGLYPSVFCTADVDQPSDQGALCDMSCTMSSECDAGAYCMSGSCTPRGMAGDACTATSQCGDGLSCVDGVCCTSSCTSTCMACNVAGSRGTCSFVPTNTDPAGECGGLSCSGYYWGWAGTLNDQCYLRSNPPASSVFCDGGGACQDAGDICPSRGQGALAVNCDDTCQTENAGSCMGMSIGTCTNSPSGSQSCGTGECSVTVPRCASGSPVTCTPDPPEAETCDNLDNNCNGATDDGLSGDGWESNNNCAGSTRNRRRAGPRRSSSRPRSTATATSTSGAWTGKRTTRAADAASRRRTRTTASRRRSRRRPAPAAIACAVRCRRAARAPV